MTNQPIDEYIGALLDGLALAENLGDVQDRVEIFCKKTGTPSPYEVDGDVDDIDATKE